MTQENRPAPARWMVAATAPDQLTGEMWHELLVNAQVSGRLRPSDVASFLGMSAYPCRVLVPANRIADARAVLARHLEGTPYREATEG